MSDVLPPGWINYKFENALSNISNGISDKQNKEKLGIPVTRIETISKSTIDTHKLGYVNSFPEEKRDRYRLNKGDILFSHINSDIHLGKTAIFDKDEEIYHGTNLLRLEVNKDVTTPEFINYQCKYLRLMGIFILHAQHAVNQSSLNQKKIKSIDITLPPLPEQNRIADKLDCLLAKVDTCKARLEKVPEIIKRFRQSVLADATSGRLTEDWRKENPNLDPVNSLFEIIRTERYKLWEENEVNKYEAKGKTPPKDLRNKYKEPEEFTDANNIGIPNSWKVISWNQLSTWITYGFTKPMSHTDDGPLIITAKNVRNEGVDLSKVNHTSIEDFSSLKAKDKPTPGDILIVKDGATTGRACLAPDGLGDYCIMQSVAVVWLKYSSVKREYLLAVVQSNEIQDRIRKAMAGMAMPHLSITDFGKMPLPLPPLEEQCEIVRRLRALLSVADQMEEKLKRAQMGVEKLTASILAKAFRGELVPQRIED